MTVVVVVGTVLGLVLLGGGAWLLVRQQRRLARIEALLADRPAGLSEQDAVLVAETAARLAVAAVARPSLPPALTAAVADPEPESTTRRSETRIKASGWAAGASETVRRLRQGA